MVKSKYKTHKNSTKRNKITCWNTGQFRRAEIISLYAGRDYKTMTEDI